MEPGLTAFQAELIFSNQYVPQTALSQFYSAHTASHEAFASLKVFLHFQQSSLRSVHRNSTSPYGSSKNLPASPVLIAVSVQVNKHTVFVSRYIIAVLIHEIKHHATVLVYGIEVIPVAYDNLQLLSLQ